MRADEAALMRFLERANEITSATGKDLVERAINAK
jgi:hypothetical protein